MCGRGRPGKWGVGAEYLSLGRRQLSLHSLAVGKPEGAEALWGRSQTHLLPSPSIAPVIATGG